MCLSFLAKHNMFVYRDLLLASSIFAFAGFCHAQAGSQPKAKQDAPARDPTYPACDKTPEDHKLTKYGTGLNWQNSGQPNLFVAPPTPTGPPGACGWKYTDNSNIVCVAPGHVHSANINQCGAWVQVFLPETGVVTQAMVSDVCGAVPDSKFGCNDIYLGKQVFEQLAGSQRTEAVQAGRLPGQVQWQFIAEPCWACYAGLNGTTLDGGKDSCKGQDNMGFTRCGRKHGGERIVGAAADYVCNQQVTSCQDADKITPGLPKFKGKSDGHITPPVKVKDAKSATGSNSKRSVAKTF